MTNEVSRSPIGTQVVGEATRQAAEGRWLLSRSSANSGGVRVFPTTETPKVRLFQQPGRQWTCRIRRSIDDNMIDLELQLIRQNPACLLVLQAYQSALLQLREESAKETAKEAPADTAVETDEAVEGDAEASEAAEAPATRRAPTWISRLPGVDGVDDEELSWVHGQLIAYGLLKCDLRDRSAGVVYQLTSEGRLVLEHESGESLSEAA